MNLKKITTITTAIILMTSFSYGQNDEIIIENSDSLKIKRINIGLKIGIPNMCWRISRDNSSNIE